MLRHRTHLLGDEVSKLPQDVTADADRRFVSARGLKRNEQSLRGVRLERVQRKARVLARGIAKSCFDLLSRLPDRKPNPAGSVTPHYHVLIESSSKPGERGWRLKLG